MQSTEFASLVTLEAGSAIQPSEYRLVQEECTIGRSSSCHIVVARSDVSRLHARVLREGPRYMLYDADSANGTFVNGRPLGRAYALRHHDVIGLGDATPLLRFLDTDPTIVRRGRLRYDSERLTFSLAGSDLSLTPNETRLLLHLYQNRGTLCTYERCATAIWGDDYEPGRDSRLDGVLRDIRNKLRIADSNATDMIKTHRNKGYELEI